MSNTLLLLVYCRVVSLHFSVQHTCLVQLQLRLSQLVHQVAILLMALQQLIMLCLHLLALLLHELLKSSGKSFEIENLLLLINDFLLQMYELVVRVLVFCLVGGTVSESVRLVENGVLRDFEVINRSHTQVLVESWRLSFVVNVGIRNKVKILKFAPLGLLALQSQVRGFFIDGDAFDFTLSLADAVFAQVKKLLKIRIQNIDFFSNVVELVAVALAVVGLLAAAVCHEVEHADLAVKNFLVLFWQL